MRLKIKKSMYLGRAKQTVWVKAYASVPDLRLNAPSSGIQPCQTEQVGLSVSSMIEVSTKSAWLLCLCLLIQYGYYNTVYCFS